MFKRKPGPSAFVGSNIELGRVISFHKAAGLEIVFFRQDVLSRIIVYIKAVLKKKKCIYPIYIYQLGTADRVYRQFRVDINKFEKGKNIYRTMY